nr:vegetative cell wall protein gp1-like [Aegilops tauschii subsp. strangulata]
MATMFPEPCKGVQQLRHRHLRRPRGTIRAGALYLIPSIFVFLFFRRRCPGNLDSSPGLSCNGSEPPPLLSFSSPARRRSLPPSRLSSEELPVAAPCLPRAAAGPPRVPCLRLDPFPLRLPWPAATSPCPHAQTTAPARIAAPTVSSPTPSRHDYKPVPAAAAFPPWPPPRSPWRLCLTAARPPRRRVPPFPTAPPAPAAAALTRSHGARPRPLPPSPLPPARSSVATHAPPLLHAACPCPPPELHPGAARRTPPPPPAAAAGHGFGHG